MAKRWVKKAFDKNKGLLHKKLGVPEGSNIPAAKLAKAEASDSPTLRKEASLAQTAKSFHHKAAKRYAGKTVGR